MSTLAANFIQSLAGKRILNTTGGILQVVQTVKTDVFSSNPSGVVWTDITGLSVSITPSSSTNKILILCDVKGTGTQSGTMIRTKLLRNNTDIYVGDAASNRPRGMAQFYGVDAASASYHIAQIGGTFLDSPGTTSSVTYKIQIGGDNNSSTIYINRTAGDRDDNYRDARVASSITAIEIAA